MDNVKSKIIAVVIVAGLITVGVSIPLFLKDDTPPNGNGDTPGDDTPNDPPVLIYSSPLTNPTINEGETQDFGVNVTDLNNDILVYQWILNDSNVGTNSANYSYVSDYNSAGNYSVNVTISDGKTFIEKAWNLTVNNVNRAPVLSNPNPSSDPTINEGDNQEFNITATDPDLDSLTYHWTENGTTVGGDSDTYLHTTNLGDSGDYEIKVNVTDGEAYVTNNWILHVSSVNSAPQLSNPNPASDPTIYETETQEFNITAIDTDNDPLTYVWTVNGSVVGGNFSTYTHDTHYQDEGIYLVLVNVTDGVNYSTYLWTLTVLSAVGLVTDLREGEDIGSSPGSLMAMNGYMYFRAYNESGLELYRTDGTEGGTTLVKDINPGGDSSTPTYMIVNESGNVLYFNADNGLNGTELWRTNGTESGTYMVKDLIPGAVGGHPYRFILFKGILYFKATHLTLGDELWRSDGTEAGTYLVKDINPTGNSNPNYLTILGDNFYFAANDGVNGTELWVSNGTTIGTKMLIDLNPSGDSNPDELVANGSVIYFAADNGTTGVEFWKTDGTAVGTVLVKNINNGFLDSNPETFTIVGDKVFFVAENSTTGIELYVSDGTDAGTHLVKDIWEGGFITIYTPKYLVAMGDILMFAAYNMSNNGELWRSDGTEAGTYMVKDINPSAGGSPNRLFSLGDRIIFAADNGTIGHELWTSNGSEEGTFLIKDINEGAGHANPNSFVVLGDLILFAATGVSIGNELWYYKYQ